MSITGPHESNNKLCIYVVPVGWIHAVPLWQMCCTDSTAMKSRCWISSLQLWTLTTELSVTFTNRYQYKWKSARQVHHRLFPPKSDSKIWITYRKLQQHIAIKVHRTEFPNVKRFPACFVTSELQKLLLLLRYNCLTVSFSRTTWVSRYKKDKTSLDLDEARWWGFGCTSISVTICIQSAPCSRQITTPPHHHSIFTGRVPFLMHNQQCESTESRQNCKKVKKTELQKLGAISKLVWLLPATHFMVTELW